MASIARAAPEPDLFGPALPPGLAYERDFLDVAEEQALLAALAALPFREAAYREYTARRRIVSYGAEYDFSARTLRSATPVPQFLLPLREKVARWVGVEADAFSHALATEYRPGTPLGWHRDTPEFGIVAGVSLGGTARMRWRPYPPGKNERGIAVDLAPRSAYVMRDDARWKWQHAISPTKVLRYSITFRTLLRAA